MYVIHERNLKNIEIKKSTFDDVITTPGDFKSVFPNYKKVSSTYFDYITEDSDGNLILIVDYPGCNYRSPHYIVHILDADYYKDSDGWVFVKDGKILDN